MMVRGVCPTRPAQSSVVWETMAVEAEQITTWLDRGSTLTTVHGLLSRRGAVVPYRALRRYAAEQLEVGREQDLLSVSACEPGCKVQVVLGRLGMLTDETDGRRRAVHGLIFTAVYSRHIFAYPLYRQTPSEVIAGFEAAWAFFGGVFAVAVPTNIAAIVERAYATGPALNDVFRDYADTRCFTVTLTGLHDIPSVEHNISYVRSSFFAGAPFRDLADCRGRAEHWCAEVAGMRVHSTTGWRPAEVFAADERPKLNSAPGEAFDIPTWTHPRVAPDGHVQVAKAFYSAPGDLVGRQLDVRADASTVKLYWRGELIRVHDVAGLGHRRTHPADGLPRRRLPRCAT